MGRRVKLKAAFKKPLLQCQKTDSSTLPSTTEEESGSPRTTLDGPTSCFARSRIGTETSVETSIENTTCIQDQESFEEELAVHALSKEDDDVLLESNRNGGSSDQSAGSTNHRTSLSAASSNDSLHSESNGGGS